MCAQSKILCKAIGKFCLKTGYGVSDCERRYSSTLPLPSALNVGGGQRYPSAALPLCVAVWVVSKAALVGSGKSHPTAILTPNPASCNVLPYRPTYRDPTKFLVGSLIEEVLKLFEIEVLASSNESLN